MNLLVSIFASLLLLSSVAFANYEITENNGVYMIQINAQSFGELASSLERYAEVLSPAELAAIDQGIDGSLRNDIIPALRGVDGQSGIQISSANRSEVEALQSVLQGAQTHNQFISQMDNQRFLVIANQANSGCLPKAVANDQGMQNLYMALSMVAAHKKCRIQSINMPNAGQRTRGISLGQPDTSQCAVKLHEGASGSIGMGSLDIVGSGDGATNTITWQANHRIAGDNTVMSVREWLYGSQQHTGFIQQLEAKNFCDDGIAVPTESGSGSGVNTSN